MKKYNFNTEDINKFLEYLRKHNFEPFTANIDAHNVDSYYLSQYVDYEEIEEHIGFPGDIVVSVEKDSICLDFSCAYPNYIEEEDHEFSRLYVFKEINKAIEMLDWYFNNNPITHEMTNTVLFNNGHRVPLEELEELREEYQREEYFLEDCGFKNHQEYENYKASFAKISMEDPSEPIYDEEDE